MLCLQIIKRQSLCSQLMLDVLNDRYVEVSFTETVKSTAPAFTLVLSSLLLGEIIQKLLFFKRFNSQNINLISRWKNHKDDEIVNFTSDGRACLMFRYWIIIQPRWFYFCIGYKYFWVVSIIMLYHKHDLSVPEVPDYLKVFFFLFEIASKMSCQRKCWAFTKWNTTLERFNTLRVWRQF